ncbi:hypothetical protein HanPSC8_Chr17g0790551 [Helianthus annuus]|nr:hypothetical protein HanPSC8_Chr17g0790551 [Helianthus annuus]
MQCVVFHIDAHRQTERELRAFCPKHTHTHFESLQTDCKHCACNRKLSTH